MITTEAVAGRELRGPDGVYCQLDSSERDPTALSATWQVPTEPPLWVNLHISAAEPETCRLDELMRSAECAELVERLAAANWRLRRAIREARAKHRADLEC